MSAGAIVSWIIGESGGEGGIGIFLGELDELCTGTKEFLRFGLMSFVR